MATLPQLQQVFPLVILCSPLSVAQSQVEVVSEHPCWPLEEENGLLMVVVPGFPAMAPSEDDTDSKARV